MKKWHMLYQICLGFMGVLFLCGMVGCCSQIVDASKLQIVTSFYPMYIATANLVDGVDAVELHNLTASTTGCLHDYQLSTSNMVLLTNADIFIINGGGMESFLEKAMEGAPQLKIINASEKLLETNVAEESDVNAHIWVSISLYQEQVKQIAEGLCEYDPAHATQYQENAEAYIAKLETLREEMQEALEGIENKKIVTFHEAFSYFAEEFQLEIVAVIEREPGTYPSAGEVARIIDTVRETGAKAIFVEPQYSRSAADTIARETGIPVYTLDPVVTGELDKDAYETVMRENLATLQEALQP